MKIEFEWEPIGIPSPADNGTRRAKVIGGWIVNTYDNENESEAMVFVPDCNHAWEVE